MCRSAGQHSGEHGSDLGASAASAGGGAAAAASSPRLGGSAAVEPRLLHGDQTAGPRLAQAAALGTLLENVK